jgi:hypothetical protein
MPIGFRHDAEVETKRKKRPEEVPVWIVLTCIAIFVLTLGAALLGLHTHRKLPPEQKTDGARSILGQVSGLVSLLLALVLGTLVGTSYAFFSAQKTELETLSAQILQLDQAFAQYGPETKPARDKLKQSVEVAYNTFWGGGQADPNLLSVSIPIASAKATKAYVATLNPTTEAQKQAVAAANTLTGQIEQSRILMDLQVASHPASPGLLTVLTIWAVFLFFCMGVFVESNGLVLSTLTFGAVCVAFAIFLILELGLPYTGMFRVSGAALQAAMNNIDNEM